MYATDELVNAWVNLQRLPQEEKEDSPYFWANNKFYELVYMRPRDAWLVILEILNTCSDEWVLANLAAGPLEELLAQHGDSILSDIKEEFLSNAKLRDVVRGGVWRNNISDSAWEALQRLIK